MFSLGSSSLERRATLTLAAATRIVGASIVVDGGWSHQMYPYELKRALRPDQFPSKDVT